MNFVDLAILGVFAVALIAGLRSGFFPQLLGLIGAVIGGVVVVLGLEVARDLLNQLDPSVRAIGVLTGLLVAIAVGEGLGSNLGRAIQSHLGGFVGALDALAGGAIGLAQGILVVWLVGGAIAVGPIPELAAPAQRSTILRAVSGVVQPPTAFVDELGRWLDASGLPDVFIGLEPFPATPVQTSTDGEAASIAAAAESSTVRVRAVACNRIATGTGFAIAAGGYVVTNAHVVAGATAVVVGFDSGPTYPATVVLFDPELDVAVLHAPKLKAPALAFSVTNPDRGAKGAALGHPGGAALQVIPAAVTNGYQAAGRDIYGTNVVSREIIELRAAIARGDSGGPFILPDGTVGGVVYAEAISDPNVGYALGPVEVAARVEPAVGSTAEVTTGACIR